MFNSPFFFVISRLCRSATNGDLEGVKYLATPENVNAKGWLGWTPLHKAAQLGHSEIVKYLLNEKLNAMIDIRDLENHTPLLLAAGTNQETPGHVEVVKNLIEKGADVNATDDGQYSSLHLAVLNSNFEIAHALLEAKCNVNHLNVDKFTPLHSASSQGNPKFIQLLINYGADPSLKDARGKTPIELARRAGINLNVRTEDTLPEKVTTTPNVKEEQPPAADPDHANSLAADQLLNEIEQITSENK